MSTTVKAAAVSVHCSPWLSVPSWAVTEDMLNGWGFVTEKRDHCVGAWHIARAGMTVEAAKAAAHEAGLTHLSIMPTAVWEAAQVAQAAAPKRTVNAETFAWFMSIKR